MSTELSGKMIWNGVIAVEMVDGWTNTEIEVLQEALNDAVQRTFEYVEAGVIVDNPLVRLVIE